MARRLTMFSKFLMMIFTMAILGTVSFIFISGTRSVHKLPTQSGQCNTVPESMVLVLNPGTDYTVEQVGESYSRICKK